MAIFRPHTIGTPGDNIRRRLGHILSAPFSALNASVAGARKHVALPLNTIVLSAALLLGGFVAGALISTQWQARAASAASDAPVTRQSDRQIVAATISRLETQQADLKNSIANLRSQLNDVQGADARRKTTLADINNEIDHQRLAAGTSALHGSGVVLTLDDSTTRSIPENEDPANYILHDYDLRDVLNTLWVAGAEAISLNGERIVSSTSLYCVGTTIIANATRLSPPYEIRAVGDPQALDASLRGSAQMSKFNQRAEIYDLPVSIVQNNDVQVPAYNGSFVFKYAAVQGQK